MLAAHIEEEPAAGILGALAHQLPVSAVRKLTTGSQQYACRYPEAESGVRSTRRTHRHTVQVRAIDYT
jgi:hypothetical protein